MKGSYIIAAVVVIVVVIIVAAAVAILMNPPSTNDQDNGGDGVSTDSVSMRNLNYEPMIITVSSGTTVTWYNNDTVDHTVTSTSGPASFDSGVMGPGDTFSFTFTEAGEYDYYCTLHPFMTGQVFVSSSA